MSTQSIALNKNGKSRNINKSQMSLLLRDSVLTLVDHSGLEETPITIGSMGTVIHAADNSIARPTGYGAITWIGSVEPLNAVDNDIWEDTSV